MRKITVRNDSNETMSPPRVQLTFDNEIGVENVWGASAELDGKTLRLSGNDWNTTLEPGSSARFAMKGIGRADGISCTVLAEGGEETPAEQSLMPREPSPVTALPDEPSPDEPPLEEPPTAAASAAAAEPVELPASEADPVEAPPSSSNRVIWRDEEIEAGSPGQPWRNLQDTRIIADCGDGHGQCLEISYVPTSRGSARLQTSVALPKGTDYSLRYDVRFDDGFQFVQGGKLPGLAPDVPTAGCISARAASWSARPMWRGEGSAQGYYYGQDRTNPCGDGKYGPAGVFKPGQWQTLEMRVRVNSDVVNYDGQVTLTVDGKVVSSNDNLRLRTSVTDASSISSFFFSTFYGGADSSWAPSKTTTIRFDNFQVLDNNAGGS